MALGVTETGSRSQYVRRAAGDRIPFEVGTMLHFIAYPVEATASNVDRILIAGRQFGGQYQNLGMSPIDNSGRDEIGGHGEIREPFKAIHV